MRTYKNISRLLTAFVFLFISFCSEAQSERVDFPASDKYVSYVGNDDYLLTDDEKYFLVRRWANPSLLFEVQTGSLVATGAEAFRLYAQNTKVLPGSNYTIEKTSTSLKVFEGGKEVSSIKIDRNKNEAELVKKTGLIVSYNKSKEKTTIIHPGGKKVEFEKYYSNMDKKNPRREIDHRTLYSNLYIGFAFVTPDYSYALDRDGRLTNLQTGEVAKLDYSARLSHGHVYGSYDPETSILKVNEGGDIKVFHLRTAHYFGRIDYSYYQGGNYMNPVVIPLQRSNSQLYVLGLGYAEAQACLMTDGKIVHYFHNPNVVQEKKDYDLAIKKAREEDALRLKLEEEKRELHRKFTASGKVAKKCNTCSGLGIRGYTEKTELNKRNVFEVRNGSYHFKGTSHDTWPIICGACFGKGYTF